MGKKRFTYYEKIDEETMGQYRKINTEKVVLGTVNNIKCPRSNKTIQLASILYKTFSVL